MRIHRSFLINIGKTLNKPITKFYDSDDVNVIVAELPLTSFYKKQNLFWETMSTNVNKVLKTEAFELTVTCI